ncbi:hypothetical protein TSO221_18070 [Azospirillum sp. TSO22-1]|nr:hypothetical protein TSO221_18070 [Azospirillum sp. TSO22-1]
MLAAALLAAAAPAVVAAEGFAVIYNNTRNDGGFNESAVAGLARFKSEFAIDVRENITRTEQESARSLNNFARQGIRNILLIGYVNETAVAQAAKAFPDVRFTLIDGVVDLPNVRSVLFREEEVGYLMGIAAALASRTGTVGFIGGMPIPPIQRFACGYRLGAAAAQPPARVVAAYLGDTPDVFRDRALAEREAERMLRDGADVLFAAAGFAGTGALGAAAAAGRLGIGVDVNQNGLHPGRVLTSAIKRVDVAVYGSFRDAAAGAWSGGIRRLGLADDGVDWARDANNEALIRDIAPRMSDAARALAAGRLDLTPACP